MSFNHALEITEFALKYVADSRESVDAFAEENLGVSVLFGKVFPKHQKIVAVVEVKFPRRIVWQGTASHMINLALRQAPDLISGIGRPPAEVNLFHVGEELFFQA